MSSTMLSKPFNPPKNNHPSTPQDPSNDKNQNFNPKPLNSATKTAPWMKGPLVLEPNQVINFNQPKKHKPLTKKQEKNLTQKVSGGRGKHAMKKILFGIENLDDLELTEKNLDDLEHTHKNSDDFEFDMNLVELGGEESDDERGERGWVRRKMPWQRAERMVFRRAKKVRVMSDGEMSLDEALLERLRGQARRMRSWVKVKKVGVSESVVEQIRVIWSRDELAMVKFDLPLCRNMDRAREIVETKTGGIVVWTKRDTLVVYRGSNYKQMDPFLHSKYGTGSLYQTIGNHNGKVDTMPVQGSLYEREADRLLDGLGPRFIDWWMPKPLPVDADMLPEVVPGYKPPSRLYPLSGTSKLTDKELTHLRKLAYNLPTHFVLGRNRNLQGLATAILKLWEKCHIAKIVVKWGIPNTSNEQMAFELKHLTGGVLLLRNKFYIILYRGKDFLPPDVADLVVDREMEIQNYQLQEETARANKVETFDYIDQPISDVSTVGTLQEFQVIQSEYEGFKAGIRDTDIQVESEKFKLEKEIRIQEHKYFILKMKLDKASKELMKLNSVSDPVVGNDDREIITSEERECLKKIGLKMDSTLVLGRRGVYDGVIEGLHQHWKHREIVKVVTMQRAFSRILYTAQCLEVESGGVLVSIDKMKLGYAIIIYRGKNYKRPLNFSRNLLNKKEALCKSLAMQRIGSLRFFANMREQAIYELKCKLDALKYNDMDDKKSTNLKEKDIEATNFMRDYGR